MSQNISAFFTISPWHVCFVCLAPKCCINRRFVVPVLIASRFCGRDSARRHEKKRFTGKVINMVEEIAEPVRSMSPKLRVECLKNQQKDSHIVCLLISIDSLIDFPLFECLHLLRVLSKIQPFFSKITLDTLVVRVKDWPLE